jgi:hypothetical protein
MDFYTIVLAIAVILLIFTLTYIGIKMKYHTQSQPFPPVSNTCPDYWTIDSTGKVCYPPSNNVNNPNNLTSIQSTNNQSVTICGKNGLKLQCNKNQLVWDGVSNYSGC